MSKQESDTATESITVSHDGYELPVVDLLTGRGFITGKSGSGKSNTASVIVEELLSAGFPVMIVDTDGEYWGLKQQYEVLHVGADEECDLQVGPEHAKKLADLALDENVPIILDVSGFLDESASDSLIRETAKHLFSKEKKLKKPFLLVIEECHEYIPERSGLGETGKMLVKIGKRGRKHGLGIVGISQRPADVKKDFITQANWLIWHRLTWDNDTKVVRSVLGSDYQSAVQDLADGEAFGMFDWDDEIRRIQWKRKNTFDAGATPDLGEIDRPELKSVSGDLVDELEDISQREATRKDRMSRLEARIDELEEENASLESDLAQARDMQEMAEQFTSALLSVDNGDDESSTVQDELSDIKQKKNARIRELEAECSELQAENDSLKETVTELEEKLDERPELSDRAVEAVQVLADEFGSNSAEVQELKRRLKQKQERVEELESATADAPQSDVLDHPAVSRYISRMQDEISGLDDYESAMLLWLRDNGPGTVQDAYWAAGGSRKSSAAWKKMQTLQDKDLAAQEEPGEYRYELPTTVAEWFANNDAVSDEDIKAIVAEIESGLR